MFRLFKKNPLAALIKKHDKILEEAFLLSKTNRKLSDQKYAEAETIQLHIDALKAKN